MRRGPPPFNGTPSAIVFDEILNRTPPSPSSLNPNVPPKLEEIIGKSLEKDRDLRYQTAAELRGDLKRLKRDSDSGRAGSGTASAWSGGSTNPKSGSYAAQPSGSGVTPASAQSIAVTEVPAKSGWRTAARIVPVMF